MTELFYDTYSVAYFILTQEMSIKRQMESMNKIFEEEKEFLLPELRNNRKNFISKTMFWINYISDKDGIEKEFPLIEEDFQRLGKGSFIKIIESEFQEFNFFFKLLRLRIKYGNSQGYVRMKLRTLLSRYGYKRRSDLLIQHFRDCFMFYHIQTYLREGEECNIREISLDDMIIFRI